MVCVEVVIRGISEIAVSVALPVQESTGEADIHVLVRDYLRRYESRFGVISVKISPTDGRNWIAEVWLQRNSLEFGAAVAVDR